MRNHREPDFQITLHRWLILLAVLAGSAVTLHAAYTAAFKEKRRIEARR